MPSEPSPTDRRAEIERDRETVRPRDRATNEAEPDPQERDRRGGGDAPDEEHKD
ncbi:MAG: hypothetical protein AB1941_08450 [Gemmatimonadota bacterium]